MGKMYGSGRGKRKKDHLGASLNIIADEILRKMYQHFMKRKG